MNISFIFPANCGIPTQKSTSDPIYWRCRSRRCTYQRPNQRKLESVLSNLDP